MHSRRNIAIYAWPVNIYYCVWVCLRRVRIIYDLNLSAALLQSSLHCNCKWLFVCEAREHSLPPRFLMGETLKKKIASYRIQYTLCLCYTFLYFILYIECNVRNCLEMHTIMSFRLLIVYVALGWAMSNDFCLIVWVQRTRWRRMARRRACTILWNTMGPHCCWVS